MNMAHPALAELPDIDWHKVGWGSALVGCGGDLATTMYGLQMGIPEQNPFVVAVMGEFGIPGLVGLKLIALSWVFIIGHFIKRKYGTAAAFGIAVPSLIAAVLNTVTIAQL